MSRKKLTEEEKKISKNRARAKYREKNRELLREKNREYRKENPETVKESNKKWRENNRETVNAIQRRYIERNLESRKETVKKSKYTHIKRIYGLSKEQFFEMMKNQNDCCAICFVHKEEQFYKTLAIDHCHKTGRVRGLLCSNCNTALGLFKDNKDSLQRAIQYLQQTAVLDSPAPMCDDGSTPEINPAIPQEDRLDNYKQ